MSDESQGPQDESICGDERGDALCSLTDGRAHATSRCPSLDLNGEDRPPRVGGGDRVHRLRCLRGSSRQRPSVLERVRALLPPGWKPAGKPTVRRLYSLIVGGPTSRPGVRRFNLLYSDGARLLRTHDLEETLGQLELDLELYIADRAPRRTFVHAGVVGWKGQAIVIPGRSFSGKSSLVKALVKAGASYYSDEFAVLDERGRVHPYPIPLVIRPGRDGGPPMKYRAEELGGAAGVSPLPVGLVLITRYVSGTRFRPRPFRRDARCSSFWEIRSPPGGGRSGSSTRSLSSSRRPSCWGTRGEAEGPPVKSLRMTFFSASTASR